METHMNNVTPKQKIIGILFLLFGFLIMSLAILSSIKFITGRVFSPTIALYGPVAIGLCIWIPLVFLLEGKARVAALLYSLFTGICLFLGTELKLTHIFLMLFLSLPCWLILAHSTEYAFLQIPAALFAGSSILFSIILFSIHEHNMHFIFRVLFRVCDLTEIIAGGLLINRACQWMTDSYPVETDLDEAFMEEVFMDEREEEQKTLHV